MRAIRTAPQKQTRRATNIVDQPREQQRKAWSTDNHYSKLKYRGLAEKRSRAEGTPDFSALDFVHGPPPSIPKATTSRPVGDPYGRREITNHRVQEEDPEDRPQQGSEHDTEPLKEWETDKVPQMCASWRGSRNCQFGAEKCRFMHRDRDPKGREYPMGDINGWVPFKYRVPPITCPFWYRGRHCKKAAEECLYAHWDTGWGEHNGKPTRIEHLPEASTAPIVQDVHLIPYKMQDPPITCSFWLRDARGCNKTDEACKYAHWNTGWAPPESNIKGQPVRIDRNLKPRWVSPKYANPPVTCPFWLRSELGCTKTDDKCIYAHRNTGWAPPKDRPFDPPVKLDLNQIPCFRREQKKGRPEPKSARTPITCYFWLEGPGGCSKTAESCNFAHQNTGWIIEIGKSTQPKRIDPNKLPRFRKHDPTELSRMQNGQSRPPPFTTPSRSANEPATYTLYHALANKVSGMTQAPEREYVHGPLTTQDVPPKQLPVSLQMNRDIEQCYNLYVTHMFHSGIPNDDTTLDRRAMLLYHPEEHPEEVELISRWLLMHNVEVGNLWYDGAWSHFQQEICNGKSGIIIVHPDFEQFVYLPGFGEVLKKRIRVWSVGLQPPAGLELCVSPDSSRLQQDRVEIFPHGGFIYITDDVFEEKPQLALNIIKLFFAKIEQLRGLDGPVSPWKEVDNACLLWRLCVRPELMEYLYLKCQDNSAELAAGNPDYLSRAELYQLLHSHNYIEQDGSIEPWSPVQDKYPILCERRVVAERLPLDYFNRAANSQEDANTHMIGYYAAMQAADMRRVYRQFYIVHTEPDSDCAQDWKKTIHSIADVISPDQCVKELSKASKESLFDFLDWAMSPSQKQLEHALEEGELDETAMEIETVEHTPY